MVFVSVGQPYDPEGLGGLGAEGHSMRGGQSLMGIGGPSIPVLLVHQVLIE